MAKVASYLFAICLTPLWDALASISPVCSLSCPWSQAEEWEQLGIYSTYLPTSCLLWLHWRLPDLLFWGSFGGQFTAASFFKHETGLHPFLSFPNFFGSLHQVKSLLLHVGTLYKVYFASGCSYFFDEAHAKPSNCFWVDRLWLAVDASFAATLALGNWQVAFMCSLPVKIFRIKSSFLDLSLCLGHTWSRAPHP